MVMRDRCKIADAGYCLSMSERKRTSQRTGWVLIINKPTQGPVRLTPPRPRIRIACNLVVYAGRSGFNGVNSGVGLDPNPGAVELVAE